MLYIVHRIHKYRLIISEILRRTVYSQGFASENDRKLRALRNTDISYAHPE